LEEARQLLEASMAKSETLDKPWQCQGCGEKIEAQFTQCWKCGTEFWLSES
jgi:DNA-directed RNA polymerase subunit RPC12/RpoP